MRQSCQPLAQQPINLALIEPIADSLQRPGVVAREDAVVERLEGDAALAQLALGVLVAVDTQPGVVRKVGTELQEERAEVAVDAVEIVVVHHRAAIDHPGIAHAGACTVAPLGAHHARLLLGAADIENPFVGVELLQILQGDVVLALMLAKAHQIHTLPGDKLLDACHEGGSLRRHCRGRGKALTEMTAQVPHHATYALQLRHINVQVHPVDALAFEHDVVP